MLTPGDGSPIPWNVRLAGALAGHELDEETRRRVLLLYGISLAGISVMAVFSVVAFYQQNIPLAVFDLSTSAFLAANLYHTWKYRQYSKNILLGIICTGFFFSYLFITGGTNNSAFVWYYTFPPTAVYLLGSRKGAYAAVLMAIPPVLVYFLGGQVPWITSYHPDVMLRFVPALLVVTLFAFLFEWTREQYQKELHTAYGSLEKRVEERTREWSASNKALQEEVIEREAAQGALEASHKTLVTILEGIDADVYVSDMETFEILFMNGRMKEHFGSGLVGEKCWKAFRQGSGPCEHCTNPLLVDGSGRPSGAHLWEGHNPVVDRWYMNYDRAIQWVDGRLVRLQVATDITERKHMEEQLRQSQKMEAMGTLAGGIAHDFNNILGAVLGYTELTLVRDELSEKSRSNLQEVLRAANRAKELVKQILMFSRKGEESRKPVQIHQVVEEATKLIRQTLPATIEVDVAADIHTGSVLADATQIHQVVMNLGTNAYHAMRRTGGRLGIRLEPVEVNAATAARYPDLREGPFALLTVADTGSGMDPVTVRRIFDPFFTTKDVGEGTGMGLSVVHGIVQSHGGAIGVESGVGTGTTFKVFLPLVQGEAQGPAAAVETPPARNERILLVDDEPVLMEMLQEMLESLGYRITPATSPGEALETFRSDPNAFDLLLTDQTMPEMTGDRLARAAMQIRPGLPVIICTGYSDILDDARARDVGIGALLMKPVDRAQLAQALRDALGDSA